MNPKPSYHIKSLLFNPFDANYILKQHFWYTYNSCNHQKVFDHWHTIVKVLFKVQIIAIFINTNTFISINTLLVIMFKCNVFEINLNSGQEINEKLIFWIITYNFNLSLQMTPPRVIRNRSPSSTSRGISFQYNLQYQLIENTQPFGSFKIQFPSFFPNKIHIPKKWM